MSIKIYAHHSVIHMGGGQNLDEAQISCTEAMLKLDACVQF